MIIDDYCDGCSWNPEDSSTNDNEALIVEKEDSPPPVGVPEPERYLPRYCLNFLMKSFAKVSPEIFYEKCLSWYFLKYIKKSIWKGVITRNIRYEKFSSKT